MKEKKDWIERNWVWLFVIPLLVLGWVINDLSNGLADILQPQEELLEEGHWDCTKYVSDIDCDSDEVKFNIENTEEGYGYILSWGYPSFSCETGKEIFGELCLQESWVRVPEQKIKVGAS